MAGLEDFVDETSARRELHVMQIEYEEQYGEPIVHLWCRGRDDNRTWVEVEGHRPSFYISDDAHSKRIENHDWVCKVGAGYESIHGDELVRVETRLPWHVGGKQNKKGLRDYFDNTWEADVFFTSRFLIDTGIKTHFAYDEGDAWSGQSIEGDCRVHVDDIEAVEDPDWRATPRTITADIEVLSPDGFPEPADAEQPVTGITAYDDHTEDYTVWVLRYSAGLASSDSSDSSGDEPVGDGWAYSDTELSNLAIENRPDALSVDDERLTANIADVRVFENESQLLHDFNTYIQERRPDLLSGWNSSTTDNGHPFDYPYLINRCTGLNVSSYRDWSPMGQVWDGNWGPSAKGVAFFDMLKAYKKTQWQKPKGGYSLNNIADKELPMDEGKLDIEDIDTAWRDDPATFLEYNIRDVQAVVGIDESADVVELFQNIRSLAGVQFENCHNNIDLLDVFILRYAKEMGMALPTNEEPDRGFYYGAHVFEPKLGRHQNVVYPDLWSMYPNMIRNANMSPETLVGTAEDLAASEYTEDDCRWTYVDTRNTNVKKEADPEYEKLYFLKPSIQTGFMTEVVDDLMGLKDYYDGTALYDAVKRIVNSVYGVYGDSDSYGKGYRLFDWRVAEGITLGGRKMIQDTADHFVDALNDVKDEWGYDGRNAYLVGGDTDSAMCAVPFTSDVSGFSENHDVEHLATVQVAHEAANRVNDWYDEWTAETFNLEQGEHYCELEIESYAPWAFVPQGVTKEKAKKRYAEIIAWNEGEWETPPEFSVTGIDIVRSDRALATRELSEDVLTTILREDDRNKARDEVYDTINEAVDAVKDGEKPNSYISRPKGMSKHPTEYGSVDQLPMPTYKGAKYANQHFPWEQMGEGSKPELLYIDRVRGDWPRHYDAETKENGKPVDAVAGEHPDKIPDEFVVDTEKQIEKVIRDPLTPILEAMRWDFDEALSDSTQAGISEFM